VRVYHETNSHLEKLFALHFRLLGRLAAIANQVEQQLDGQVCPATST
jgi:hypothetical protein